MSDIPAVPATSPRVLVAGVGNVLRGDDGFGPAVVEALERSGPLPDGVRTVDVGIGGVSLVHELLAGCDALIIVDAVDRGGAPGSLYVLEPHLTSGTAAYADHPALAADLHELVPSRVLVLARALDVLPPTVRIVGCQPDDTEEFSTSLTPAVAGAVASAVREILLFTATLRGQAAAAGARRAPQHSPEPRE